MEILDRDVFEPSGTSDPGSHRCLVFDDAGELVERIVAWAQEGFDSGERVVYVEPTGRGGAFVRDLTAAGLDLDAPLRDGQLVLLSAEDALLVDGDWDLARRMALHERFVQDSVRDGFAHVRMAAEAAPALGVIPDLAALRAYEIGMGRLATRVPVSVTCFYERQAFGAELGRIALVHPRGMEDRQMRVIAEPGHVRVVGEVDISNTHLMGSILDEAVPVGGSLVIDLAGVSFIDVGGAGRLVELARRLGGRVRVVGAPRQLQRILVAADWQDELELVSGGAA